MNKTQIPSLGVVRNNIRTLPISKITRYHLVKYGNIIMCDSVDTIMCSKVINDYTVDDNPCYGIPRYASKYIIISFIHREPMS